MKQPLSLRTSYLSRALKGVLLGTGLLCVALGFLGLFLPLLPTVPFLLLAAGCFARSSERLHCYLLEHRRLGPLLRGYLDGGGIPRRAKVAALVLIWLSIPTSALLLVPLLWARFLLFGIAVAVTIYLVRLPSGISAETP